MTPLIEALRRKSAEHAAVYAKTPSTLPNRRRVEAIKADFCAGLANDVEALIAREKAKIERERANDV